LLTLKNLHDEQFQNFRRSTKKSFSCLMNRTA
jgi:hypothetical protein